MNVLLVSLLLVIKAPDSLATTAAEPGDSLTKASSFEVGMYMGANWTINLMLAVHQPQGATISIKDTGNTILYRQYLKKSSITYHHKFKFEGSQPGVYQIEISDGQKTVTRQVEVVDIPAIESQRYITYGPKTNP